MTLGTPQAGKRRENAVSKPAPVVVPVRAEKTHYKKFFRTFGRAYRTKHVRMQRANPLLRILGALWGGPAWMIRRNNRPYYLPWRTGLPKEFIRLDPWEGEYVFTIARLSKIGILEIGRFNGGSAFLMTCANPDVPIYSIDLAPQDDELLKGLFRQHGVGANVDLIVGDSQCERSPRVGRFDVLFVDGDHSYDGCTRDAENWFPLLEPGGHMLFHDAYQGSDVQGAAIDFFARHHGELDVVVPPYIPDEHWHLPTGSVVHAVKAPA